MPNSRDFINSRSGHQMKALEILEMLPGNKNVR